MSARDSRLKNGQVGLKFVIRDAVPKDMQEYGSEKFFLQELTQRVNKFIEGIEIRPFKIHLVKRNGLTKDCIIEPFKKGSEETTIILPVGFNKVEAIDDLWKAHQNGNLSKAVKSYLESDILLKPTNCVSIDLKITFDTNEYKEVKGDLLAHGIKELKLEDEDEAKKMLHYIKDCQKVQLTALIEGLRDDDLKFDKNLGVLITTAKHHIPESMLAIKNRKEFHIIFDNAKKAKEKDIKVLLEYDEIIDHIKMTCQQIHEHIFASIDQIPISCHSKEQNKILKEMREMVKEVEELLDENYNWSKIRHPDWMCKILPREQPFFGGAVCLIPIVIEKLIDFDHKLDEYFETLKIKIK